MVKNQSELIFLEKPTCQLIWMFFLANWLFGQKKKGQKWPHGNSNISTTTYRLEV
jgi:hypothetical protein